jgi:hypothetical protein
MRSKKWCLSLLAALAGLGSLPASAAPLFLEAVDAGGYNADGVHLPAVTNYFAGVQFDSINNTYSPERRNFFVFDLSAVTEPVSSATLRIQTGTVNPNPNPMVPPANSIQYSLYSVATPVQQVIDGSDTAGNKGIFADLGTPKEGVLGGPFELTAADSNTFLEFELNDKAIDELNKIVRLTNGINEDDLWVIGGAVDLDFQKGFAFAGTFLPPAVTMFTIQPLQTAFPVQLFVETSSVPVPEPTTHALLAIAALALLLSRRRLS